MKKLIVITGASSGIGMELAKEFSKQGYPTLLLARRKEEMEKLKLKNSIIESCDITNIENVEKTIKKAEEIYGKTDLLINCAGVMLLGDATTQNYQEWSQMIDVNIKGILTTTHQVLKHMVDRNQGTIINISSIAGHKTFNNHAIYCGTKFAVSAITESIRKEISSSNVRMITISPGVVETPLLSHTTDNNIKDNYNEWKKTIQGGIDPQKIVECVLFAYNMPQDICVRDIVIAKTKQAD